MNKGTIVGLNIAAVGVLAGVASAIPLSVSELADQRGFDTREIAQGGGGGSSVGQDAESIGPYMTQLVMNAELGEQNTEEQPAAISGETCMLLGAGFLALAWWQGWSRGKGLIPRKSIIPGLLVLAESLRSMAVSSLS